MNQQASKIIKEAEEQFSIWRSTRKRREPIPNNLWNLAYEVADHIGDSKACILLKLNHTRFKERKSQDFGLSSKQQKFIEVPTQSISRSTSEAVLIKESSSGTLTICLQQVESDYLAQLAQMLLVSQ